eukprot:gene3630-7228_t
MFKVALIALKNTLTKGTSKNDAKLVKRHSVGNENFQPKSINDANSNTQQTSSPSRPTDALRALEEYNIPYEAATNGYSPQSTQALTPPSSITALSITDPTDHPTTTQKSHQPPQNQCAPSSNNQTALASYQMIKICISTKKPRTADVRYLYLPNHQGIVEGYFCVEGDSAPICRWNGGLDRLLVGGWGCCGVERMSSGHGLF